MAMIYFVFLNVNSLMYYAMTTVQQSLAIVERLSQVLELEEFNESGRCNECAGPEIAVQLEGVSYTWGFKVKSQKAQDTAKKGRPNMKIKAELELDDRNVLEDISFDIKAG